MSTTPTGSGRITIGYTAGLIVTPGRPCRAVSDPLNLSEAMTTWPITGPR
jgi:hypothetical protein